jgi:phosphoribosylanthranilate isomerase
VKICGLVRPEDAGMAVAAGADYLGAILSPGFSRSVDPALAASFPGRSDVPLVAVLVDEDLDAALRSARTAGASVIQLHGQEPPELLDALRREAPWHLWKAVHVRSPGDVTRAVEVYGEVAHGLLLEGWHETARGGAGAPFAWEEVAQVRGRLPEHLALVVAGGLTPDNVERAVEVLAPHVVDVSSGVEARLGAKDPGAVQAFIRNARRTEVSDSPRDAGAGDRRLRTPTSDP